MKKALIFASVASMIDQFNMDNINILQKLGYRVDVACNFEFGSTTSQSRVNELRKELENGGVRCYHIPVPRKITSISDIIKSYKETKRLINKNRYDIVHCHSPIGGVIAREACKRYRKMGMKVIYTAHGFHFFKGAPLKNWIVLYPIEWWLSRYTDVIITINKEDYNRAKRSFKSTKIEYVPGVGIDTKKISEVLVDKSVKRRTLGIPDNAFVVLSVGELNKNKNHETIIKAISKLNNLNVYYVICGQGELNDYLKCLISNLNLDKQVKLLGYREDIIEINKVADVFAFPSKREGLGVAALEAMACGLPIITSNVHGIVDYSIDGVTGYTCCPSDVNYFTESIQKLSTDNKSRNFIKKYNINQSKYFDIKKVMDLIKDIYEL